MQMSEVSICHRVVDCLTPPHLFYVKIEESLLVPCSRAQQANLLAFSPHFFLPSAKQESCKYRVENLWVAEKNYQRFLFASGFLQDAQAVWCSLLPPTDANAILK